MSARRVLLMLLASFLAVPLPAAPSPPAIKQGRSTDALGDPLPAHALLRVGTVRFRHGCAVTNVFVAPDGKTVLSAGLDNTLRVWDLETGKELGHWQPSDSNFWISSGVAISPDGKRLAYSGLESVRVCDAVAGHVLHTVTGETISTCHSLRSVGDSDVLVCVGTDKIQVLRADTGEELRSFSLEPERPTAPVEISEGFHVPFVALSADGSRLLSAQNGRVSLWDVDSGKKLRKLTGDCGRLTALALSPDHRLFAWGDFRGGLALGDTSGKELQFVTPGSRDVLGDPVAVLAFSPQGNQLACGHGGGTIRIYATDTGKQLHGIAAHGGGVSALAYTPDGRSLVSGDSDSCIRVWDTRTGQERVPTHDNRGAVQVALSPDGTRLATVCTQQPIHCWETATGKGLQVLKPGGRDHEELVDRLFFSADGSRLTAATDRGLQRWDLTSGRQRRLGIYPDDTRAWNLSPDGRVAVRISARGTKVTLLDRPSGRRRWQAQGKGSLHGFLFSEDTKVIGLWWTLHSEDDLREVSSECRVFDVATGKELYRLSLPLGALPLALTPDGAVLMTSARSMNQVHEDRPRRWVVESGIELPAFEGEIDTRNPVAVSPDGKMLVSGDEDGVLTLWELATGKRRGVLEGHRGPVGSFAFSADGKRLSSGSRDTTALLWDVTSVAAAGKPPPRELTAKDLDAMWADLRSDDAAAAYRAVMVLAAFPTESVPYLRKRVAAVRVEPQQLSRLVADLDSESYESRKKAQTDLAELAELAEPALRAAGKDPPSAEVRRSIEELLEKVKTSPYVLTGERLRAWRALEALELCGTAEACEVLATLAQGDEAGRLTREAKLALERVHKRGAGDH
jgi:WD40 repeat protein